MSYTSSSQSIKQPVHLVLSKVRQCTLCYIFVVYAVVLVHYRPKMLQTETKQVIYEMSSEKSIFKSITFLISVWELDYSLTCRAVGSNSTNTIMSLCFQWIGLSKSIMICVDWDFLTLTVMLKMFMKYIRISICSSVYLQAFLFHTMSDSSVTETQGLILDSFILNSHTP